ncbi:hypothetical protein MNEG_6756 [Monoraphidium neglectum]|jgi:hypothetical protein|uniref:Uncharacterized protein n=1 Tax=Monoraphidium neglectum TaxID=145388 RepID=A0A0D2MKY2_9CHLO|nr:hypothetical protein MNEG_6756 [Monoraphidium neglectum]KIZ01202.1 hypothetical protein MNEG_6756 [Monoraphidium neglectum]|eukprot:XP_013900221.1 hypothetical protein MNEG_6756 [Monoraphidium neglectum]
MDCRPFHRTGADAQRLKAAAFDDDQGAHDRVRRRYSYDDLGGDSGRPEDLGAAVGSFLDSECKCAFWLAPDGTKLAPPPAVRAQR